MRKELEDTLFGEFKDLFIYKDDINRSLMKFGFDHGDGWYDLVYEICSSIKHEVDIYNERIKTYNRLVEENSEFLSEWKDFDPTPMEYPQIVQIKEKFGQLRVYLDHTDRRIFERIHGMIRFAEYMSGHICENCGNRGTIRRDRMWIQTLCDICNEKNG